MAGSDTIAVATDSLTRQDWLAIEHWDGKGFLIIISLPDDTLLFTILDDQGFTHSAGLTA